MPKAVTPEMVADWLKGAEHRCPRFAEPVRWQKFLDDVRKFVEAGWLEKCARLDWTDRELFSVDRLFPFDNPASARTGLLAALKGREVRGLHPDCAVLGVPGVEENDALHSKHLQNFSRHHQQTAFVLIWDLRPELAAA